MVAHKRIVQFTNLLKMSNQIAGNCKLCVNHHILFKENHTLTSFEYTLHYDLLETNVALLFVLNTHCKRKASSPFLRYLYSQI